MEAWAMARRNGGQPSVGRESFRDIEARGVERWLGELSRALKDGTYAPQAVRQVLIPKKQPGKFRPLGMPTTRDRVAQTSAMLMLAPIFEADLQPEQYGYRPERSAQDAVRRIHRLLNKGHTLVAFGQPLALTSSLISLSPRTLKSLGRRPPSAKWRRASLACMRCWRSSSQSMAA